MRASARSGAAGLLPGAPGAAPSEVIPARAFWIPVLLVDLLLLALLPQIGWLVLAAVLAALAAAAVGRVERLLAFALIGPSLLALVPYQAGIGGFIFYGLRALLVIGLVVAIRRAGVPLGAALDPVLRDRRTWALLAFAAWVGLGVLWSRAPEYGRSKALGFALVAPVLYLGTALLWPAWERERVLDRLISAGLWLGLCVAAAGVITALDLQVGPIGRSPAAGAPSSSRLAWLGASPIWLARSLSIWAVLACWAAARRRLPVALAAAVGVVASALMVMTGSRGPLAALLLCPLGLLLLPRGPAPDRGARRRVTSALALAAVGLLVALAVAPAEQKARVASAVLRVPIGSSAPSSSGGGGAAGELTSLVGADASTQVRRTLVTRARETLAAALPWGLGTGGFAHAFTGEDFRLYPHNIAAEVLVENGLPGVLLGLLFLLWVWRGARGLARRGNPAVRWGWALLCLALLNAQVSGDLPFNEGIWFWGGLLVALEIGETGCVDGVRA